MQKLHVDIIMYLFLCTVYGRRLCYDVKYQRNTFKLRKVIRIHRKFVLIFTVGDRPLHKSLPYDVNCWCTFSVAHSKVLRKSKPLQKMRDLNAEQQSDITSDLQVTRDNQLGRHNRRLLQEYVHTLSTANCCRVSDIHSYVGLGLMFVKHPYFFNDTFLMIFFLMIFFLMILFLMIFSVF